MRISLVNLPWLDNINLVFDRRISNRKADEPCLHEAGLNGRSYLRGLALLNQRHSMAWTNCPACQKPVPPTRAICTNCGCVIAVEVLIRQGRPKLFKSAVAVVRFLQRQPYRWPLWTLAFFPLLLAPPTAAIFISLGQWKLAKPTNHDKRLYSIIILISLLNIAISVALISTTADHLMTLLVDAYRGLFNIRSHSGNNDLKYI